MTPFGYPLSAKQSRFPWHEVYRESAASTTLENNLSQPDLTSRPENSRLFDSMKPSRSHVNIPDLSSAVEGLRISRTAASTPSSMHKRGMGCSQSTGQTPPIDACLADPFLNVTTTQRSKSHEENIYRASKMEEDAFGGGAGLEKSKSSDSTPASMQKTAQRSPEDRALAPRADRLLSPVTPQNAQGVLPPEALVFVANLSVNRSDEQLEQSVHAAFDRFGNNLVKVRRDRHRHPFALVQFYTTEHARNAIIGSRDMVIDDRKIRTEEAQARRSVVIFRKGGGSVSTEEAQSLLEVYGAVAETYPTTHADARLHGVPEGVWVKFAYYLDFKDALKHFNDSSSIFEIMEPPNLEPRTRPSGVFSSSPVAEGLRTPRSSTDQKSIFVGNLPTEINEAELLEEFAKYGDIKGCNVIRKPITGGQGFNIFGFIEYSTVQEASRAAEAEVDIRGQRIRVEPKEYSARRQTRLTPFNQVSSGERRGVAWGPSSGGYQGPGAMPYGFQPIYLQPTPGSHYPYGSGYGWAQTPPNSNPRRRTINADDYIMMGPPTGPQPYLAMPPPGYMTNYSPPRENVPEENQHQHPRRSYR